MLRCLSVRRLLAGSLWLCALGTGTLWAQTARPPAPPPDLGAVLRTWANEQAAQIPAFLAAQPTAAVTPALWHQLTAQGVAARDANDFARAQFFFQAAHAVAAQLTNPTLAGLALYQRGLTATYQGDLSIAIAEYEQSRVALAHSNEGQAHLVYVLADLGALYLYQQDYRQAQTHSARSVELAAQLPPQTGPLVARPDGLAVALVNLGMVARWANEDTAALSYLQQGLAQYHALAQQQQHFPAQIVEAQAEIGRVYRALGRYTEALAAFNQALATARTIPEPTVTADVLNSIGILYLEQRDYAKAALYLRQALTIHRTTTDTRQIASELQNLGLTAYRQGHYAEARQWLDESYHLYEKINFRDGLLAAGASLGTVARLQGDHVTAQRWLGQSLQLAHAAQDPTRTAEILWQQAETALAAGQLTVAQATATQAWTLAGRYRLSNLRYLAATVLGKTARAQRDYPRAAAYFAQAIQDIEAARRQVAGTESEAAAFFADKVEAYQQLALTQLAQNRPAEALLWAERAQGRVLLDVLRGGRSGWESQLTAAEQTELARRRGEVSRLTAQLRHNATTLAEPDETALAAQLDAARLSYDAYQNDLAAAHPAASDPTVTAPPLTLNELQAWPVARTTAYLSYLVTAEQVYLFVLRSPADGQPVQVKVYPLTVKAETLAHQAQQFRQRLATRSPAALAAARDLYALLIRPAMADLAGVTTLGIIPAGGLWEVPFQALLSPDERYLLEDFALYYAPSLAVLRQLNPASESRRPLAGPVLALGNPLLSDATALPAAAQEVTALTHLFDPAHSRLLTGADASEAQFKAQAPQYRILHLATHGSLDNAQPLYSYLSLTATPDDPINDGRLEAHEIMALRLDADLAVLSACDTAQGQLHLGEGVLGLAWAFLLAGCRTTVVSQWPVDSGRTAQLMNGFYRALAAGQSPAAAWRTAALTLIHTGDSRQPFYWAGFIVLGQP